MSIYSRLLVLTFMVAVITGGGATLFWNAARERERRSFLEEELLGQARVLASVLPAPAPETRDEIRRLTALAHREAGTRLTVIAADGTVLAESDVRPEQVILLENHRDRPEVLAARARGVGADARASATLGRTLLYVAVRWGPAAAPYGVVRAAVAQSQAERKEREGRGHLVVVMLGSLAVAAALGALVARRMVRPLAALNRSAHRIGSGHLEHRAEVQGTREMKDLAHTLNALAASVQAQIAEVETERQRLEQLLSRMPEGVLALDAQGRITLVNEAARRLLRVEATVVGRTLVEAVRHPELLRVVDDALRSGRSGAAEVTLSGAERRILGAGLVPIPSGLVVLLEDRTRLRRLEEARREMVANVGHELRTPLAAILGYLETLVESPDLAPEERGRFLDIIGRNARRLERLVQDLGRLSTLEAPEPHLDLVSLSAGDLVRAAVETLAPRAARRGVALVPEIASDLPPVRGDRHHLEAVFFNLLDNALRVSPEGGTITVRALPPGVAAGREAGVRFEVLDQGPGIPRELRERIFERFYRLDTGRSADEGGSGLGLAIVKHAVLAHGGEVGVEDAPGGGTQFWFTVPAAGDVRA